jgi:hypothetical protein
MEQLMGELCLRWAMRLPADVSLTPDGGRLQPNEIAPLIQRWGELNLTKATPGFVRLGLELMGLNDRTHLPRVSPAFLARQIGQNATTVRNHLHAFAQVGRTLTATPPAIRRGMVDYKA